jgi:hypothetical protein
MSHPQQLHESAILITNRHLAFFTILKVGPSLSLYESSFFLLDLIHKYTRKHYANFFFLDVRRLKHCNNAKF